jgi:signal transduction histidine kinase
VTGSALVVRLALDHQLHGQPTLVIFAVPIMLSAYFGGLYAGLLSTALAALAASYYLLPPLHSFLVASAVERWQLFFVVLAGVIISALNEALHRARRQAAVATLELQQARDERESLLASGQVKNAFLANMSHELRTPLNAIIGFAELMHRGRAGPLAADQKEYLGDILTSSQHLLQLVNDVLDLAKVESGKMEFRPEPVDLARLAREVVDILRGLAASARLAIEIEVDPAAAEAVVDPARVKQILYNYLSNAIKFTPPDGRIEIRIRAEGADHFRIEVEDTGVGIAPEALPGLFVEFQQLDGGAAKEYQGTGLGLALTKRLAEAHGGWVAVRSVPGQGSTFSVSLPRIAPAATTDPEAIPANPPSSGNRTILVVDDDPSALKIASLALREMGYRPVCRSDPEDALRTVFADPPGVVIVDLLMPGVDGFEFVNRFRALPAGRRIPILVWTVKDLDESDRSRLQPSVTALVSKNAGGTQALVDELLRLFAAPVGTESPA